MDVALVVCSNYVVKVPSPRPTSDVPMRLTQYLKKLSLFLGLAFVSLTSLNAEPFWLDGPQSTFGPKGPVAQSQLDVFYVTLYVTTGIFIVLGSILAYVTLKYPATSKY